MKPKGKKFKSGSSEGSAPKKNLTRKQKRKLERTEKKARRNAYYTKRKGEPKDELKTINQSLSVEHDKKKQAQVSKPQKSEKAKKRKYSTNAEKIRKRQFLQDNIEEEKAIKKLEKKLFLNKRKSKKLPKSFIDDGLGYLLEITDERYKEDEISEKESKSQWTRYTKESELLDKDVDEFEDDSDVDSTLGHKSQASCPTDSNIPDDSGDNMSSDAVQSEVEDDNLEEDFLDEGSEESTSGEENLEEENYHDMEVEGETIAEDNGKEKSLSPVKTSKRSHSSSGIWEDIYGRLRDKKGNVVSGKYVPPAKRLLENEDPSKREHLERIKKQLKGLFNRLSESTVQPLGMQIEEMYRNYSNNDINTTLVGVICDSIVSTFLAPDRLVMEHAMLVSYLHCNVGSEVGAHVLQEMAKKFSILHSSGPERGEGKQIDNIVLFISYLFMFKVTHSKLIFDIITQLAEGFLEHDIELILLILKSVGFGLRKHDPMRLKEMILLLQKKASADSELQNQSRTKFMLETLMAIRNNNIQKIPNFDPSAAEHACKVLRGLYRKGCIIQELNISFEDLLKANEVGRWWVVGSVWAGSEISSEVKQTQDQQQTSQVEHSEYILRLAQKHHMNTEVRKNIFCILMTAEDYLNANERILHLNLSPAQWREVCYVMLHCCLNERQHNPYYAQLAQLFCKRDRRFQMSMQCAIWDQFKELEKFSKVQSSNLAHFLVILLASEALSISLLKVIHFADMNETLVKFLSKLFITLFTSKSDEVCYKIFNKIADAPKLRMLREGLKLFFHHFLLRSKGTWEEAAKATILQCIKTAEAALKERTLL